MRCSAEWRSSCSVKAPTPARSQQRSHQRWLLFKALVWGSSNPNRFEAWYSSVVEDYRSMLPKMQAAGLEVGSEFAFVAPEVRGLPNRIVPTTRSATSARFLRYTQRLLSDAGALSHPPRLGVPVPAVTSDVTSDRRRPGSEPNARALQHDPGPQNGPPDPQARFRSRPDGGSWRAYSLSPGARFH